MKTPDARYTVHPLAGKYLARFCGEIAGHGLTESHAILLCWHGYVTRMLPHLFNAYPEALELRDRLDGHAATMSRSLHEKYPDKGPMGLTPDAVKATPEWQGDRAAYDTAARTLGIFNREFVKRFKKEWKATLAERREARRKATP